MTPFDKFWQVYPKRNGKKVGKHDCRVWFLKHNPTDAVINRMVTWLDIDNGNRDVCQKKFYANLPDPIRFLKRRMWEDDIEALTKKLVNTCAHCSTEDVVARYENKWHCASKACKISVRGY